LGAKLGPSISGNSLFALKGKFCQGEGYNTVSEVSPSYWTNNQPSSLQASVCIFLFAAKIHKCRFFFLLQKKWEKKNYNSRVSITKIFNLLKLSDLPEFPLTDMPATNTGDWQAARVTAPAMGQCTSILLWN